MFKEHIGSAKILIALVETTAFTRNLKPQPLSLSDFLDFLTHLSSGASTQIGGGGRNSTKKKGRVNSFSFCLHTTLYIAWQGPSHYHFMLWLLASRSPIISYTKGARPFSIGHTRGHRTVRSTSIPTDLLSMPGWSRTARCSNCAISP